MKQKLPFHCKGENVIIYLKSKRSIMYQSYQTARSKWLPTSRVTATLCTTWKYSLLIVSSSGFKASRLIKPDKTAMRNARTVLCHAKSCAHNARRRIRVHMFIRIGPARMTRCDQISCKCNEAISMNMDASTFPGRLKFLLERMHVHVKTVNTNASLASRVPLLFYSSRYMSPVSNLCRLLMRRSQAG